MNEIKIRHLCFHISILLNSHYIVAVFFVITFSDDLLEHSKLEPSLKSTCRIYGKPVIRLCPKAVVGGRNDMYIPESKHTLIS